MVGPTGSARLAAARAHLQQNRLSAAESEALAVLAQAPDDVSAKLLLGVVNFRMGRLSRAADILAAVAETVPPQIDAIHLLGVVRMAERNFREALPQFRRLISLGRETADVQNQIGACWLEMGDPVAAGAAFKRAIELDRNLAHSYYNLGMALKLAGTSFETFLTFKRSVELNPRFFDNYVELWQQMRQLLNWSEGLPILESGIRLFPNSAQMMVMLASTYGKLGRAAEAEELYRSAAKIDATAGTAYGHWLQEEGRFGDSVPILKESIKLDPFQGQAYYNLAMAKCFEVDGQALVKVAHSLCDHPEVSPEGRMFLSYTMAKSYDHQGHYELAMHHYDLANQQAYDLFHSGADHDAEAVEIEQATQRELYSRDSMERLRTHGSLDETPIFIVGMIRTGTTLLDQILSSHPSVKSAGEQPFWRLSAGRVNRRWLQTGADSADIKELERRYLDVILTATGGAARVTDKMPTNFAHMGLMSVVFPRARFIHIRRSPVDTGLSIYTTFLGKGTQFAYQQGNIVAYYRTYLNTMEYWRSVIPSGQLIEIDYEDLVTNKERVLREVLEYCGLEWDDACLHHERNRAQVSTPSLWTARQPVNTASVERWRRYEPWLGGLGELRGLSHPPPKNH